MLSCSRRIFQSHSVYKVWNAVPLCVLCIIRVEHNRLTFDGIMAILEDQQIIVTMLVWSCLEISPHVQFWICYNTR